MRYLLIIVLAAPVWAGDPLQDEMQNDTSGLFSDNPKEFAAALKRGDSVNASNGLGLKPLHAAAMNGDVAHVIALLNHGADPNAETLPGKAGRSLTFAPPPKADSTLQMTTQAGYRALHIAAFMGHREVVEALLRKGAKPVLSAGKTPLAWAVLGGDVKTIELLIRKGAKVSEPLAAGYTVISLAAERGLLGPLKALTAKSATACGDALEPILLGVGLGAQSYGKAERVKVAQWALKRKCDINQKGEGGNTPLHGASIAGNLDLVKLFLEHGARVDAVNDTDSTPLLVAAAYDRPEVVGALLASGADPNKTNKAGYTPLSALRGNDTKKSEPLLLKAGAKPGRK